MSEELTRSVRGIQRLERSIRVLELAREGLRQRIIKTNAFCETHNNAFETNQTVTKARAYITILDSAVRQAKIQIHKLELGPP